jgi:hypothetical protein
VAREENANPRFAGRFENLNHSLCDLAAIGYLAHNSDLHVVNDQGQRRSIANVR